MSDTMPDYDPTPDWNDLEGSKPIGYTGLAGLLWIHGDIEGANQMYRKLQTSGGVIPKGGFPTRCTNCDTSGVRCHREYAHPGAHSYEIENRLARDVQRGQTSTIAWIDEATTMTDHELPPKHTSKAGQTRIIASDTVEKFLNEKVESIHEQIKLIDNQLAEHDEKKTQMQRTRANLRRDENEIHEALATLKSVRARNHGESHEGS